MRFLRAVLLLASASVLAACVPAQRSSISPLASPDMVRAKVLYDALAEEMRCSVVLMNEEWETNRYLPVSTSDSPCVALGRWGNPARLSEHDGPLLRSVSMFWSGPSRSFYSIIFSLNKQTGRWSILSTSSY